MGDQLAEKDEQLVAASDRIEELEALVEVLRASLKLHLDELETGCP